MTWRWARGWALAAPACLLGHYHSATEHRRRVGRGPTAPHRSRRPRTPAHPSGSIGLRRAGGYGGDATDHPGGHTVAEEMGAEARAEVSLPCLQTVFDFGGRSGRLDLLLEPPSGAPIAVEIDRSDKRWSLTKLALASTVDSWRAPNRVASPAGIEVVELSVEAPAVIACTADEVIAIQLRRVVLETDADGLVDSIDARKIWETVESLFERDPRIAFILGARCGRFGAPMSFVDVAEALAAMRRVRRRARSTSCLLSRTPPRRYGSGHRASQRCSRGACARLAVR